MPGWAYDVQVGGTVSDDVLEQLRVEFSQVTVTLQPPRSVIRGIVPDQAALVGVLTRLQDLGLNVCEIRRSVEPSGRAGSALSMPAKPGSSEL
jgi:hypothetical protein